MEAEKIKTAKTVLPNSIEYWKMRAKAVEIMHDPTQTKLAKDESYNIWIILQKREV